MKLVLIGFGNVGQGFAEILRDKAADYQTRLNLDLSLVGVMTNSRGMLYHADGLDIDGVIAAYATGSFNNYDATPAQTDFANAETFIREVEADILVEASPTNLDTAQPALSYMQAALESGKHIVTANKGPTALHYTDLIALARANNRHVRIESTVMAGTPAIANGLDILAGCAITSVQGILNGTTNYILTQMENGMAYADALAQAQDLGYAETDPSGDVDGWDAAGKVLILMAALFGKQTSIANLAVEGIANITLDDVKAAQAAGERYKLIATATPQGGSVKPVRLPMTNPLAQVGGATNAITYTTDLMGDITLIGAGAGRKETGYGLLSDILAISRII